MTDAPDFSSQDAAKTRGLALLRAVRNDGASESSLLQLFCALSAEGPVDMTVRDAAGVSAVEWAAGNDYLGVLGSMIGYIAMQRGNDWEAIIPFLRAVQKSLPDACGLRSRINAEIRDLSHELRIGHDTVARRAYPYPSLRR